MNREQILAALAELAKSQGMYGRILTAINEMSPEERDELLTELESRKFRDVVDLVLFLEV